ncbi:MAG: nucleoside phosphorylase [Bacteroidota bacterium]
MKASELILRPNGAVYHLNLLPEDIADTIIFVGDPARTEMVAAHFERIDCRKGSREFQTITGWIGKKRLSVLSTGIGTDNIDIVWQELDALHNIDLHTRQIRADLRQLTVLRLGTCGGLQDDCPPDTLVLSRWAIGADGLMHFYAPEASPELRAFSVSCSAYCQAAGFSVPVYGAQADQSICDHIAASMDLREGITLTAAGFYGPQGRDLGRIPLRIADFPEKMAGFRYEGLPLLNLEMETAGIMGLGNALGHRTASLSVILAQRSRGLFSTNPTAAVEHLVKQGVHALVSY